MFEVKKWNLCILTVFSGSPCSGLVVTSYNKNDPSKKLKKKFYSSINQYKKFKKMYDIEPRFNFVNLDLRYVRIYFDTTTFDRITKDRAAKFVDMLSAIGGTMGLLTGFSIISGVEILYFSVKIILQTVKKQVTRKSFNKDLKIV